METKPFLADALLKAWTTNNEVTIFLINSLSEEFWTKKVPGYTRKTIQMIGGHLHNTRCMWIKNVGKKLKLKVPEHVNRYKVSQKELIASLNTSSKVIYNLLEIGIERQNLTGFPLDIVHFQNYLVAHEAHHRG